MLSIILIASLSFAAYYIYKNNFDKEYIVKKESNSLLEKVGKLTILPQGEEPVIATVKDIEKLKAQPFFINAQNGDTLIAYTKSLTAIIYRESENKIVSMGPIYDDRNKSLNTSISTSSSSLNISKSTSTIMTVSSSTKNIATSTATSSKIKTLKKK